VVYFFAASGLFNLLYDPQVGPNKMYHLHQGPPDVVGIDPAHQHIFRIVLIIILVGSQHNILDGTIHIVSPSLKRDNSDPVAFDAGHLFSLEIRNLSLGIVYHNAQMGTVEVSNRPYGRRSGIARGRCREHNLPDSVVAVAVLFAGKIVEQKDGRSHSQILSIGNDENEPTHQGLQEYDLGQNSMRDWHIFDAV